MLRLIASTSKAYATNEKSEKENTIHVYSRGFDDFTD